MNYRMRIDDEAKSTLPDVKPSNSTVEVTESQLCVRMGNEFSFTGDLSSIARAERQEDPRPEVYLTMGVSAAVDKLGRDTVAVVGSYDGLVRIDFRGPVEGTVRPPDLSPKGVKGPEPAAVSFAHLILSLEDPAALVQALDQRVGAVAATAS